MRLACSCSVPSLWVLGIARALFIWATLDFALAVFQFPLRCLFFPWQSVCGSSVVYRYFFRSHAVPFLVLSNPHAHSIHYLTPRYTHKTRVGGLK